MQHPQDLIHKRLALPALLHHKVPPALLRDLDERVARHVLHALMRLVHELEELVDDRLKELPVRLEEARVLADDVHDVRGDDGLVVLAALDLAQAEEVLDDGDEEALFGLFVWKEGQKGSRSWEGEAYSWRPILNQSPSRAC